MNINPTKLKTTISFAVFIVLCWIGVRYLGEWLDHRVSLRDTGQEAKLIAVNNRSFEDVLKENKELDAACELNQKTIEAYKEVTQKLLEENWALKRGGDKSFQIATNGVGIPFGAKGIESISWTVGSAQDLQSNHGTKWFYGEPSSEFLDPWHVYESPMGKYIAPEGFFTP